jgi:acyl carrier protein
MVTLMLGVEAEFDIEIPQNAMTPENFDTIAAIDVLVSVTAQAA